jgi:hypothetical protein
MEISHNINNEHERISVPLNDNPEASGFIHDLNKKQYEILIKFRDRLAKDKIIEDFSYFNDLYLLRFLRARKFEMDKSFLMISDFFKWRQKENVEEAVNFDYPELLEVKKLYPHTYHRTDKMGRPIYIELLGNTKFKEVFQITTRERMIRYYVREYERLLKYRFNACSKSSGRLIEQGFSILDLTGVSMSVLSGDVKDFIKMATGIGQNYYPEMLGKLFMINTSTMFKLIWSIVKGFVDKKTRNKMTVLKGDYLEELLKYVDKDNLPSFLGGNCRCSHIPGGCMFSDIGPWNPEGGITD